MRRTTALVLALPTVAASMMAVPAVATASGGSGPVAVIATHLDNPRGLSVARDRLYIAESGHGDSTQCLTDSSSNPPTTTCVGRSGVISSMSEDTPAGSPVRPRPVITGLISVSDPSGVAATGPSAVSVRGDRTFTIMARNTKHLPASVPAPLKPLLAAARAQLGQLLVGRAGTQARPVAGVGDFDYAWSSRHKDLVSGQFPDSNPNAVLAGDGVSYVIDAGSNTLDTVRGGRISVKTFFPVPAGSVTDSVPTCVDRGPDGALYVGELLGGTYASGGARVWRVVPGQTPTVWAKGLTTVNGCGFGRDGAFYATEFQVNGLTQNKPAGDVVRITDHGATLTHLASGALTLPSGFAAGDEGVYVSNCSIAPETGFGPCPLGGEVVRIKPTA